MDKKSIAWLFNELPELISKGVLPPEVAEGLRQYYSQIGYKEQKRNFFSVFAITGFLLISLGIILILAHNWDELTRPARLVISVGVLLLAQIFAGFSLWFKREQSSFTESSSVFLMLMIGTSIALVSQTYHLYDDIDAFFLTWIFLALPLIYIMRSTLTSVLYLGLIMVWVVQSSFVWPFNHLAWLLLALVLPFYKSLWDKSKNNFARHTTGFGFVFAFSLLICFHMTFQEEIYYLLYLVYISLFGIMYLTDIKLSLLSRLWQEAPRPFKIVGRAGIIAISFMLSFKFIWENTFVILPFDKIPNKSIVLTSLLMVLAVLLIAQMFRRLEKRQMLLGAAPLLAGLGCVMLQFKFSVLSAALIFNIYLLIISLEIIISGVSKKSLGLLNSGMFLLAALIIARFFDANFSFEARGAAFILVGLCLLSVNLVMIKRLKRKKEAL